MPNIQYPEINFSNIQYPEIIFPNIRYPQNPLAPLTLVTVHGAWLGMVSEQAFTFKLQLIRFCGSIAKTGRDFVLILLIKSLKFSW